MKQTLLSLVMFALVTMLAIPATTQAATYSKAPGAITKINKSIKKGTSSFKFSWKKPVRAEGYYIAIKEYGRSSKTKPVYQKVSKITIKNAKTTQCTYTKKFKYTNKLIITVGAYNHNKKKKIQYGKAKTVNFGIK